MSRPDSAAVRAALKPWARPDKAAGMQAYLKSSMPCLGVQVPLARKVAKALFAEPFDSLDALSKHVLRLWNGAQFREERFVALNILRLEVHRPWVTAKAAPLLETLILTGAWWDLVDELAAHVVADALDTDRAGMTKLVRRWAASDELWLQRTALVCQVLRHEDTDLDLLAFAIEHALDGKDFFLRKGIGWAMRAVGYDQPEVVRAWLGRWQGRLSGLSVREASKALSRPPRKPVKRNA